MVGYVAGAGMSTSARDYEFSDVISQLTIRTPQSRFGYRLKQLDLDGTSHYSHSVSVDLPTSGAGVAELEVFPNPFNPETRIIWSVPERHRVTLAIYAVNGEEVDRLWQGEAEAGRRYALPVRGDALSSGIYFVRLTSNARTMTRRLLLIR